MSNQTTITTAATVDRLISGIAKRNSGLLQLANRAAIAIIGDPANLAGRAIALLDAMAGIKAQKNLLAFFEDYLPNEVVERKSGGFILGKKRVEWVQPTLPENGLTPTTYTNAAKMTALKEERAAKVAATREKRESDQQKAVAAQVEREKTLLERERELDSKLTNVHAIAAERVGKAELAAHDAREELKAESTRLQIVLSEKSRLERELTVANSRIQELERELVAMRQVIAATATDTDTDTATATKPARRKRA